MARRAIAKSRNHEPMNPDLLLDLLRRFQAEGVQYVLVEDRIDREVLQRLKRML